MVRVQLVVFCVTLAIASAAVGLGRLEPKPEKYKNEEGCYIKELDTLVPFGEARPDSKQCMEYRCDTDWVQYVSCGVVEGPQVELVVHEDQPYPGCCPMLKRDPIGTNSTSAETTNKIHS